MRSDYRCANCDSSDPSGASLFFRADDAGIRFCSEACFWKWAWVHAPSEVAKHSDTKKIPLAPPVDQSGKGSDFSSGPNEG